MAGQDDRLIAGHRIGCIGCSCSLAGAAGPVVDPLEGGMPSGPERLAQAALLCFGAPLLLLLLGAGGAAVFASDQPAWALLGLAPVLWVAADARGRLERALHLVARRPEARQLRQ